MGNPLSLRAKGPRRPDPDYRRAAAIGLGVIVFTFGVLGLWAALAPLNSAVVAPGMVVIESNRQVIQHLEGGIVRKVLVHEGDHVASGQMLFQLDPVQTNASVNITRNQLFSMLAKRDRLVAERDHAPSVRFSSEVMAASGDPMVAQAVTDEQRQFQERRATLQSQLAVLQTRIGELQTEIGGMETERRSMDQQRTYLSEEVSGLEELFKQDLVPKPRLLAVQRELAQVEGQIGRSRADKARTEKAIGETQLQMRQLQQQLYQDISKELAEVETQSGDLRQRFTVAQDQARRINVTAPMSGVAQNLRVFTEGAVVRPGDPLVEIAPDRGQMIIQAHISPNDVDSVHAGQRVQVRFPSFHSRSIPVISGEIRSVSQDRLVDEASHSAFFMAIVYVPDVKLPPELQGRLRAGLPAEVVVPTGSRSALQYIWQPLGNALTKTMRER